MQDAINGISRSAKIFFMVFRVLVYRIQ